MYKYPQLFYDKQKKIIFDQQLFTKAKPMFGYRPDGKKVKDIDPIQRIIQHIMAHRHDSQNLTTYDCPCEPLDAFIKEEAPKGENYNYMHIVIAGLVRTIAKFPRINRFIMNGRIYMHNAIEISFVVKKNLSPNAADSLVKLRFTGLETIAQIRDKIDAAIRENNHMDANNGTDKLARILTFTPNLIIKCLVGIIKWLDRHSMLPDFIIQLSPFHTSAFITNLKSIKAKGLRFSTTSTTSAPRECSSRWEKRPWCLLSPAEPWCRANVCLCKLSPTSVSATVSTSSVRCVT